MQFQRSIESGRRKGESLLQILFLKEVILSKQFLAIKIARKNI